jgi:hypothetical protein
MSADSSLRDEGSPRPWTGSKEAPANASPPEVATRREAGLAAFETVRGVLYIGPASFARSPALRSAGTPFFLATVVSTR